MSRNRLSELQTSQNGFGDGYGGGYGGSNDLESGDGQRLEGERYELEERRRPAGQLSLSDYLDEVLCRGKIY